LCPLYLHDRRTLIKDFEVDSRPVTIPATRGRVMRHRARFNEWSCRANLRINTSILDAATVRQIMSEGLAQIGLGDFRPERGGPFGISSLVSWKVVSDQPAKTWPGAARRGAAWPGKARRGPAGRGMAGRGPARRGAAWRGEARRGMARQGQAWRGWAWRGEAWHGMARDSCARVAAR